MNLEDRLYSSTEVADILGVSLRSVYRYLEEGSLKADIKTATGRHRFSKNNILEFLYPDSQDRSKPFETDLRVEVDSRTDHELVKEDFVRPQTGAKVSDIASKAASYKESDYLEPLNPIGQTNQGFASPVARPYSQVGSQPISQQVPQPNAQPEEPIDWLAKFREAQKARLSRQGVSQPVFPAVPPTMNPTHQVPPFAQQTTGGQDMDEPMDFLKHDQGQNSMQNPMHNPAQNFGQPTPFAQMPNSGAYPYDQQGYQRVPQYQATVQPMPQMPQAQQMPYQPQTQPQVVQQPQPAFVPQPPVEEKPVAVDWLARFKAAKAELEKSKAEMGQQGQPVQASQVGQTPQQQAQATAPVGPQNTEPAMTNQMTWEMKVKQDREALAQRYAQQAQPQPVPQPVSANQIPQFVQQPQVQSSQQVQQPQVPPVQRPEPRVEYKPEPRPEPAQAPQQEVRPEPRPEVVYQPATARVSEIRPAQPVQPVEKPQEIKTPEKSDGVFNYYTSGLSGLKELAHSLNKSANTSMIPYCFTMYAGMSLYKSIRPFSILHAYVKPEHRGFFEKSLQLKPCERDAAQLCLIVSDDKVIFETVKEMHGLKVVSLVRLRKDLLDGGEDELAGELDMVQS